MVNLNKTDKLVVSTLEKSDAELSLGEIAAKTGEPKKKVFKSLRKLFENEMINCENRRYRLRKG